MWTRDEFVVAMMRGGRGGYMGKIWAAVPICGFFLVGSRVWFELMAIRIRIVGRYQEKNLIHENKRLFN